MSEAQPDSTRQPTRSFEEHAFTEVHGFELSDWTHRPEHESLRDDLIWVGTGGEGRWLKPEDALELAAAIENIAHGQLERVFRRAHSKFLRNHPDAPLRS